MAIETQTIVVNKSPVGAMEIDYSSPDATFKLTKRQLGELKEGEVLAKVLYLSNDPSQRAWIQKGIPPGAMYVEPIREGDVMGAFGLVEIIESKLAGYSKGEVVNASCGWNQYVILNQSQLMSKVPGLGLPLPAFLSYAGAIGLTAYYGLLDVGGVKAGDVLVVSGAAGATGSMVVQIAKILGCKKVIGIAGGAAKCEYVKSLGADECVDYKDKNFAASMYKALGEDKECDVYFDGVGGEILDTMFLFTKQYGTIVACGSVAGYNTSGGDAVRRWGLITVRKLTVKGFIVIDYLDRAQEGIMKILTWIKEGKIKVGDDYFDIVDLSSSADDFKKIPSVLETLFNGKKGPGKTVVKLADPSPEAKL